MNINRGRFFGFLNFGKPNLRWYG